MLKQFKSVGHFFATVFTAIAKAIPVVEKTEGVVETVTAAVPVYGPLALPIEKLGYALLGEVANVITAGSAAQQKSFADAGLDVAVIESIKDMIAKSKMDVATVVAALTTTPPPAPTAAPAQAVAVLAK